MSNDQPNMIIYRTADGKSSVAIFAKDSKVWLSQQQMAELFATSKPNISMHIANILKEKELNEISVVKKFLTTAADGKLNHLTKFCLLIHGMFRHTLCTIAILVSFDGVSGLAHSLGTVRILTILPM